MHWRRKWQPTPVFLPGESQGRKAWWAAIYGVAQSQTRLKRCSSSSSSNLHIHHECLHVCTVVSDSLWPHGLKPARFLCPWDFPGKNIRGGCHFLIQGVFLTQGENLCLLHCKQILYYWVIREALWSLRMLWHPSVHANTEGNLLRNFVIISWVPDGLKL